MELYIISGRNGVGKTTFARTFLPKYADCKNFVNADLIAQGMSPFSPEAAAIRAGRLVLSEIAVFLAAERFLWFRDDAFGSKLLEVDSTAQEEGLQSAPVLPLRREC